MALFCSQVCGQYKYYQDTYWVTTESHLFPTKCYCRIKSFEILPIVPRLTPWTITH